MNNAIIWNDDFVGTEQGNVIGIFMYSRTIRARLLQFAACKMVVTIKLIQARG